MPAAKLTRAPVSRDPFTSEEWNIVDSIRNFKKPKSSQRSTIRITEPRYIRSLLNIIESAVNSEPSNHMQPNSPYTQSHIFNAMLAHGIEAVKLDESFQEILSSRRSLVEFSQSPSCDSVMHNRLDLCLAAVNVDSPLPHGTGSWSGKPRSIWSFLNEELCNIQDETGIKKGDLLVHCWTISASSTLKSCRVTAPKGYAEHLEKSVFQFHHNLKSYAEFAKYFIGSISNKPI